MIFRKDVIKMVMSMIFSKKCYKQNVITMIFRKHVIKMVISMIFRKTCSKTCDFHVF